MAVSAGRNNPIRDNVKCIIICIAISMANMQYGFDVGAIAGFQSMVGFLKVFGYPDPAIKIGWGIKTKPQQLIASCLNLGTIIGLFTTPIFSRYFGRRPALWVGSLLTAIGCAIQISTDNLGVLSFGRVMIGLSNSFFITFANIYIVEAAPAHLRAVLGSFFGIWVNIGAIVASGINLLTQKHFDNKVAYQIPLACLYLIPLVLSILVFFVPESPRWLVVNGRTEEAEEALRRLRGTSFPEELLKEEFFEIVRGIEEEKAMAKGRQIMDMFRGTDRRRTILCVGVIVSHSSSGLWLYLAYGTYFYQMAGIKEPFQATVYSIATQFIAIAAGMYFMFKVMGRRSMMLFGTGMAAICMLTTAIIYNFFFYMGWSGTLSLPLSAEIVSSRLRVTTFSFATAINYFCAWLISFCSPYFLNPTALNWGPKYCYIWAASNAITFLFYWFLLPDVKGRSLEEIDELFENKIGVKNFPKYQCRTSTQAHEKAIHGKDENRSSHTEMVEVV